MYTKQVIRDIEIYYSRYLESTSDQMLYYTTKYLLDFLRSFEVVKTILSNLKSKYPYDDERLEMDQNMEGFSIIKQFGRDRTQYVSYILHLLDYSYNKQNAICDFYDETPWICYSNDEYDKKERIRLFKIEVVRPLCDYVIDELRKYVSLIDVLEMYRNRTMRFETPYSKEITERQVQNQLAIYLFDRGYMVHREEDLTNGKPDFLLSDDERNPFIIEVKLIKEEIHPSVFKSYTSQLRDYMNKLKSYTGVLCIFTEKDYDFVWNNKPNNMTIITIYVGATIPSKRNTQTISLDIQS